MEQLSAVRPISTMWPTVRYDLPRRRERGVCELDTRRLRGTVRVGRGGVTSERLLDGIWRGKCGDRLPLRSNLVIFQLVQVTCG